MEAFRASCSEAELMYEIQGLQEMVKGELVTREKLLSGASNSRPFVVTGLLEYVFRYKLLPYDLVTDAEISVVDILMSCEG